MIVCAPSEKVTAVGFLEISVTEPKAPVRGELTIFPHQVSTEEVRTELKGMRRLHQEASGSCTRGRSVAMGKGGREQPRQLRASPLVIFNGGAVFGVCVYVLYILTRYTHKYLIYKK